VFRGRFKDALKKGFSEETTRVPRLAGVTGGPRSFARFLRTLHQHDRVMYVKKPFGGPEHVLHYLARYNIASPSLVQIQCAHHVVEDADVIHD
jgi:hypothetical protein